MYEARLAATDVHVKTTKAQALLFFATANKGLLLQQRLALELDGQVMLGLNVPHIFLAAPTDSHSSALRVTAPVMRDFVGMAGNVCCGVCCGVCCNAVCCGVCCSVC